MAQWEVNPATFLTPQRFDVAAKLVYGRFIRDRIQSDWGLRLYAEHVRVWGDFHESRPWRSSLPQFVSMFSGTMEDMRRGAFDFKRSPVVVDHAGVNLINGAHRIAAAILHAQPARAVQGQAGEGQVVCNHSFFRNRRRYVMGGLAEPYMDAMAAEYCRHKLNVRILLLYRYPDKRIREIVEDYGEIVYTKRFELTGRGPANLLRELYMDEAWARKDGKIEAMATDSVSGCAHTWAWVVQMPGTEEMTACKKAVRKNYRVGKTSCHATDSPEETCRVAGAVLNANSIAFLNRAEPQKRENLLRFLTQDPELSAPSDQCVTAGGVLSAYGLREASDLDLLNYHWFPDCKPFECHNKYANLYGRHPDDVIFNPENHFYFHGVKFASPGMVRRMKTKRDEPMDRADVVLLDRVMGLHAEWS